MIYRTLLGALKYKPDYIVVVSDEDHSANSECTKCFNTSGWSMETVLERGYHGESIKLIAEGSGGGEKKNLLGRRLSELCGTLADRGFFNDPKNSRYIRKNYESVIV